MPNHDSVGWLESIHLLFSGLAVDSPCCHLSMELAPIQKFSPPPRHHLHGISSGVSLAHPAQFLVVDDVQGFCWCSQTDLSIAHSGMRPCDSDSRQKSVPECDQRPPAHLGQQHLA